MRTATGGVPTTALLRAEVLRVRTARTTWWLLGAGVLVVAVLASLYGYFSREVVGTGTGLDALADPRVLRRAYLSGYSTGFLVTFLLGTFLVSAEMVSGRFALALLGEPRRTRLLRARALVGVGYGTLFGLVLLGCSVGITALFALGQGAPLRIGEQEMAARLGSALVAFPCWTLIGLGLGMLLRHQVATVAVGLGWILLIEVLLTGLFLAIPGLAPVLSWLPRMASAAVTGELVAPGVDVLPIGLALVVLAGWGAVLWAAGTVLLARTDIAER